ncbi:MULTISPECIES: 3,4-dihydroxy-2-butanone-4-phosphate synthase [Rhodococcus]|uniref:3,4-dihydroxy-2-butanone-4-phosphate synthase n=1 Tax=Rhodococcus TaxID=1827 RepID=UPI00117B8E58|nr:MULTISPECIES: 3,4-dihydroxy-2-butanone-4-phosphate synthase [Rhodococcus]
MTTHSSLENPDVSFGRVRHAISEIAHGKPVVLVDNENPGARASLVFAADHAGTAVTAFAVRHSSGFLCAVLTEAECDRLDLLPISSKPTNKDRTDYRVTVDSRWGIGTGISAHDRGYTLRALADPQKSQDDFTRPGHVVPICASADGVLQRAQPEEAALDLVRLAHRYPAAAICEIVSPTDGTRMADSDEISTFAAQHNLALISVADILIWRATHDVRVQKVAETRLATHRGDFTAIGYRTNYRVSEFIALLRGDVSTNEVPVLIRSQCLTSNVLGSCSCHCRPALEDAIDIVADAGHGIILFARATQSLESWNYPQYSKIHSDLHPKLRSEPGEDPPDSGRQLLPSEHLPALYARILETLRVNSSGMQRNCMADESLHVKI